MLIKKTFFLFDSLFCVEISRLRCIWSNKRIFRKQNLIWRWRWLSNRKIYEICKSVLISNSLLYCEWIGEHRRLNTSRQNSSQSALNSVYRPLTCVCAKIMNKSKIIYCRNKANGNIDGSKIAFNINITITVIILESIVCLNYIMESFKMSQWPQNHSVT